MNTKTKALRAHASQIEGRRDRLSVPPDVQCHAWPYESYILARSRFPAAIPERSLLDGLDIMADLHPPKEVPP